MSAGATDRRSLRTLTARVRADVWSVGSEWRGGDRSSLWSLLGRAWTVVAGLLILALATTTLSPATQGYFFTFMGLVTAQAVLEVGFAAVLAQFSSHEWSALRAGADGQVTGPIEARARLGSLIRLAQRWYLFVGVAVAIVLGVGGSVLLASQGDTGVAWATPWWLLIAAQALVVQTLPLSGLLEGCDRVTSSQRSLLVANVLATSASAIALALGAGLYALALAAGVRAVAGLALLLWQARDILALRHCRHPDHSIGWRHEFLPQQWRIGLSWMAGFAMFQSFTPIAFAVGGPVVAGTVGVAAQAFLITQGLGLAWVTAAQPRFGMFAARRDMRGLRAIARATLWRSLATASLVALLGWATAAAITAVAPGYGERFGGLLPLGIFLLCAVLLQISNVETTAVRFRKREPFVVSSLVGASLVILSSAWFGTLYGATGVALGFFGVLTLVLLPWVHALFLRHTREEPPLPGPVDPGLPQALVLDFTAGRRPGGHHEHYLDALEAALAPFGAKVWAPYRDGWSRQGKFPPLMQKFGLIRRGLAHTEPSGRVLVNQYPWPSDVLVLWLVSLTRTRPRGRLLYVMRRTPSADLLRHWNYRLADRLMLLLTQRGWLHPISDSRVALEDWQRRAGVDAGSLVAIPPPPDPGPAAAGERLPPPGTPTFGLVGALRAEKGAAAYEAVIEAALGEFPAAGFHVQLGSPAADRQDDIVATLERRWGSDPRVRLHEGHLDPVDYTAILTDCDVVVLPYDVERYGTGTSGVLHEALSSGASVLTTPLAWAVAEYSGDPDVIFLPDTSPERLREGLRAAANRAGQGAHRPAGQGALAFSETWREAVLRAAASPAARASAPV